MARGDRYPGGYYQDAFQIAGESEGSGSSGRVDTEITASEDSRAPPRKSVSMNFNKNNPFGVPTQFISLSNMTRSEKKMTKRRLELELEQVRVLQRRVEIQRRNGVSMSSSSDILSCSNAQITPHVDNYQKTSALASKQGKKVNSSGLTARERKKGRLGKPTSRPNTANVILMKQCETLLKRLMTHQYSWVFKTPVDIVKWNIPDYFTIIKKPMDLETVKSKLSSGSYSSPLDFAADVRLTFSNAMTYNPPGNDVHIMADTLSKYFEVRWKTIEKKLPVSVLSLPLQSGFQQDKESDKSTSPPKKRKATSVMNETQPLKHVMTPKEKQKLSQDLESLLAEMPVHIVDFLRENCTYGTDPGEDEIEIDIDNLSDDTLLMLRKLIDDYLQEKQSNQARGEASEIEILNESGLSNSSMQHCKGSDPADDDIDIGGNEPPVSSYPHVEIEKDAGHRSGRCISSGSSSDSDSSSSDSESEDDKASTPLKVPPTVDSEVQLDQKTSVGDSFDANQCVSEVEQHEQTIQQKQGSVELDSHEDGNGAPPERRYRAALLKNRFAETILKAQEKTLAEGDKGDPERLRQEREALELQRKKEKERLQAEARAAEDARKRAEAEAAAEAKRKRELEREAARQALLKMERTVEINESSRFLEDLEMLRSAPGDIMPSSVDEASPDQSQGCLGSFKFGGQNPLEKLGLYMKEDEDDEDGDLPCVPHTVNDVEEGEI